MDAAAASAASCVPCAGASFLCAAAVPLCARGCTGKYIMSTVVDTVWDFVSNIKIGLCSARYKHLLKV